MDATILQEECAVVAESRALLDSYHDFMYGLRSNKFLYDRLEQVFRQKTAALVDKYNEQLQRLMLAAETQGIALQLPDAKLLEVIDV